MQLEGLLVPWLMRPDDPGRVRRPVHRATLIALAFTLLDAWRGASAAAPAEDELGDATPGTTGGESGRALRPRPASRRRVGRAHGSGGRAMDPVPQRYLLPGALLLKFVAKW